MARRKRFVTKHISGALNLPHILFHLKIAEGIKDMGGDIMLLKAGEETTDFTYILHIVGEEGHIGVEADSDQAAVLTALDHIQKILTFVSTPEREGKEGQAEAPQTQEGKP